MYTVLKKSSHKYPAISWAFLNIYINPFPPWPDKTGPFVILLCLTPGASCIKLLTTI